MRGKCWIYKRATLYSAADGKSPTLVDYSNGTKEFNGEVKPSIDGTLIYEWKLPGATTIEIPVNVSRRDVHSIIRSGTIDFEDGSFMKWEFIFGRFEDYFTYYIINNSSLILLVLLIYIIVRFRSS
jgi:hypothetical protein